jgi:CRISPR type III-associated protein (TIGR04423 family)
MNKLSEIKNRKYTGYIWMSDEKKPVFYNEGFDFSDIGINPFIIEALLFCKEENISLTIRHTGKYHINEIDLNDLPEGAELVDIEYLPHRLNGIDKVCFKQLWIPEKDKNCEGWPVLKMKALVFTGFKYQK